MNQRAGDAGPVLVSRRYTVAVGIIAAAGSADVALPPDAAFADPSGAVAVPVDADFDGAPGDGDLGIIGAWVSTPATGVVTVRFCGLPGPTAAVAAQKILVTRKA
jgi:hypothetical protein